MDVKEVQMKKREMEEHLLSLVMGFESETEVAVAAIKIERVDTSTLEGKSNLIDSLEVILTL